MRRSIITISKKYQSPDDLPEIIPVFPLQGAILLPRATMPLHIFEPRYLMMLDDVIAGDRLLGMIQPSDSHSPADPHLNTRTPVRDIGCIGRVTSFTETNDDRLLISLTGISRFVIVREQINSAPYRSFEVNFKPFAQDLVFGKGEELVDRDHLLKVLKDYLDIHDLTADWDSIGRSSNELLVNTLSMISPYGPEEKQALLEAADLKARSDVLIALAEMELASQNDNSGGKVLQ